MNKREYTCKTVWNGETPDFVAMMADFKANGFNVTKEALQHNYDAWKRDYKSGYCDKENGYFLYSACGCNPLYFFAETLTGADWQKTYIA